MSPSILYTSLIVLVACLLHGCHCYPKGAPQSACKTMIPKGHKPSQADPTKKPPFLFKAEPMPNGNGEIMVTLSGLSYNDTFRGFFIMARDSSSSSADSADLGDRGHGHFHPAADSARLAKVMDCPDLPAGCPDSAACAHNSNAITQKSAEEKESVSVVWTPPESLSGKSVTFVATVVEMYRRGKSVWWKGIESNSIDVV